MIEDYHFGSITINGETYEKDVELRWNGEILDWWRDEGHFFAVSDIERALSQDPEVVVLGTGNSGRASITQDLRDKLREEGVEVIDGLTQEVIEDFNNLIEEEDRKVIGLFHLTC